jgi:hypothetical protein
MRDTSQTSSAADIEHVGRAWLRDGTRDPYVLQQIFHAEEFNVSTAPQFAGVRANYERTLAAGDTPLVTSPSICRRPGSSVSSPRDNAELVRKNTAANPLIEIVEAAVHDQTARLSLTNPEAESSPIRSWKRQITERRQLRPSPSTGSCGSMVSCGI